MSEISARSPEAAASESSMALVELAPPLAPPLAAEERAPELAPRELAPEQPGAPELAPSHVASERELGVLVFARRLSFEELYTSSYQSLVRLAFVLTGSVEIAEDLVQDCFVRLHGHYEKLETPERYARQAVVNACRSHFRRLGRERDRRPLLYVVDGDGQAGIGGASAGELHDVLLELPYRQRVAIVLRYYADQSEVEIAEVLGCRPGTVGSLIHRGLERLRGVLEP